MVLVKSLWVLERLWSDDELIVRLDGEAGFFSVHIFFSKPTGMLTCPPATSPLGLGFRRTW